MLFVEEFFKGAVDKCALLIRELVLLIVHMKVWLQQWEIDECLLGKKLDRKL